MQGRIGKIKRNHAFLFMIDAVSTVWLERCLVQPENALRIAITVQNIAA
jgi:hypothetical protein